MIYTIFSIWNNYVFNGKRETLLGRFLISMMLINGGIGMICGIISGLLGYDPIVKIDDNTSKFKRFYLNVIDGTVVLMFVPLYAIDKV